MKTTLFSVLFIAFGILACSSDVKKKDLTTSDKSSFSSYWKNGKAEISSYTLMQSRYGEVHKGKATTIFVTEPFQTEKQVKADYSKDSTVVDVLKLNLVKQFNTGLYQYNMMLSAFTPLQTDSTSRALKTTMSSQEWCGMVFEQTNSKDSNWISSSFSYFESEGDVIDTFNRVYLEDEIWNQIRLNPSKLPIGSFQIIEGSFYRRLLHKSNKPKLVEAHFITDGQLKEYVITFSKDRILRITFEDQFPYLIQKWEETLLSGYGKYQKPLKTTAVLDKRVYLDYWNYNRLIDKDLRKELNLDL